jgi:hypothetical protein
VLEMTALKSYISVILQIAYINNLSRIRGVPYSRGNSTLLSWHFEDKAPRVEYSFDLKIEHVFELFLQEMKEQSKKLSEELELRSKEERLRKDEERLKELEKERERLLKLERELREKERREREEGGDHEEEQVTILQKKFLRR